MRRPRPSAAHFRVPSLFCPAGGGLSGGFRGGPRTP